MIPFQQVRTFNLEPVQHDQELNNDPHPEDDDVGDSLFHEGWFLVNQSSKGIDSSSEGLQSQQTLMLDISLPRLRLLICYDKIELTYTPVVLQVVRLAA